MNENMNQEQTNSSEQIQTEQSVVQNEQVTQEQSIQPGVQVPPVQQVQPIEPVTPVEPVQPQVQPVQPIVPMQPSNPINNGNNLVNMPNTGNVKTKKSHLGLILAVIVIIVALVGVYLFINKGGVGKTNSPEKLVKNYVNNLINKKYESNFELVYLPKNSYVKLNDYLEYAQTQSKYQNLSNKKIDKVEENLLTLEDGKYIVTLKDENEKESTLTISVKKNDSNEWKVTEDNLFITNWSLIIPKGTTLYIDGEEVNKSLSEEVNNVQLKYVIPAISSFKKNITLDNPLQKKELELTPLDSNSNKEYKIELKDRELINKAYEYVKNTWNAMYQDYVNGVDVSDVKSKYFDATIDVNDVKVYYTDGFDALTKGSSGHKNKNFNMPEVVDRKDADNSVFTDEVISLNFGYKLTWDWDFWTGDGRTMTRYSHIRLKIDGDSFKIYNVTDIDLFRYENQFTHNY